MSEGFSKSRNVAQDIAKKLDYSTKQLTKDTETKTIVPTDKDILEAFVKWLSTRTQIVTISIYHDNKEALDLVNQYLEQRGK